jgi:acyl carrier protein
MHTIEEKFSQIFKYMGIPQEQVKMEASFTKDFDFEDFQFTCLAFYIGIYFKINIRERDYAELNTIGSTIDFVKRKLNVN